MSRNKDLELIWCDGCGMEIILIPLIAGKQDYCCQDCLNGQQCDCGENMEIDEYRRGREA